MPARDLLRCQDGIVWIGDRRVKLVYSERLAIEEVAAGYRRWKPELELRSLQRVSFIGSGQYVQRLPAHAVAVAEMITTQPESWTPPFFRVIRGRGLAPLGAAADVQAAFISIEHSAFEKSLVALAIVYGVVVRLMGIHIPALNIRQELGRVE